MRKRILKIAVLLLCVVLTATVTVNSVLAWLVAETDPVINTFYTTGIVLELDESEYDPSVNDLNEDKKVKKNEYPLTPGWTLPKDPVITVKSGSEACWLFVRLSNDSASSYLEYDISDGWTNGNGTDIPANVWYREVATSNTDQDFNILKNNQVKVKDSVKMDDISKLNGQTVALNFIAYAIQTDKGDGTTFEAKDAWAQVSTLGS